MAHMARCATCGGDNLALPSKEPESFWSSDLGIEEGLFFAGVIGLVVGLHALATAPDRLRLVGGLCAALGAGALVAFPRLYASELSKRAKWSLRLGVFALTMLFSFLQEALK
ncbi:MAG TPA: hypothetical protein VFQ51_12565 [Vicinamibacteria bacterium]|nr:hypothetical protein [Vicinamibacteria bacterium]